MEAQEVVCAAERCWCKAICYREEGGKIEPFCVLHFDSGRDILVELSSDLFYVDICVITDEDIRFIEKAQEVFKQAFAKKERSEKDQFNRNVYKLIRLYFNKRSNFLLKICRTWQNILMNWKHRIHILLENEKEKVFKSEVIKRAEEIYLNFELAPRYLDLKTLFDLMSVSNDNIGILSLCENGISTEEKEEDSCFSTCKEIRSCIYESYYLMECVYYKKKPFPSSNLSEEIISTKNVLKDLDKPSRKFKINAKELDVNEKLFTSNTLNMNDYLSVIARIYNHDKPFEILIILKSLNSDEQNKFLEFYLRYLRITSTLIFDFDSREAKISQLKDKLLFKKNIPSYPITYINVCNNLCQHDRNCGIKSSYYLPELGVQLCSMHRFHKDYSFCSEYVPLLKSDSGQPLEILYRIQNLALKVESTKRYEGPGFKLEDPIINLKRHPMDCENEWIVLCHNEMLRNWVGCYQTLSKVRDFNGTELTSFNQIQIPDDLDIKERNNYCIPTLNDYESDPKFIINMLKIEILEYIVENRFPTYWREKKFNSKSEEIIEYLCKDYVYKELGSNFKNIESNIDIFSTQKDKNYCSSVIEPNMRMGLNCPNKSKKELTNKYDYLSEESFEQSSYPSDSKTNKQLHEENKSTKTIIDKDFDQEPKSNCQLDENNYDEREDHSVSPVSHGKDDKQLNPGHLYTENSCSEIGTSSNNSGFIDENENINLTSLGSESKNMSVFTKEEECKAQNLEYSEANSSKIPEEVVSIEKYTEDEIKDLIDEAEQEVYTQRKRYYRLFNYKSLSEYFINKKYYKLKLLDSDDLLLEYDLSNFEEFREFASNPRWKKQISISSLDKITAKLDTENDIQVHLFIKSSLCEFETLELRIHKDKLKDIKNFLIRYFPISCQYFKLNFGYGCKLQIDYYFKSLINLSSRVTEELYILRWKLRQRQMMTIFKEFKHVCSLAFESCIFALESVPEFGSSLEGSNVKELGLFCYDYGHNGYGVEHLIEGLSQSNGFLQNLDTIYIDGWEDTEETKEKLKEYVDIEKLVII
ncbi:unnamed protein product [Moneuplotes crassus]|uniref:Uncharacterized protein n=1 Tax=Euplotes crassus TaxID=5936 RepID=A0AAD1XU09_EUPCR|nr:unnamed protein product [Moneuplotes crassus]